MTPSPISAPLFSSVSALLPKEKDPRWLQVAKVIALFSVVIPLLSILWDLARYGYNALSSKNVSPLPAPRPRSHSDPVHPTPPVPRPTNTTSCDSPQSSALDSSEWTRLSSPLVPLPNPQSPISPLALGSPAAAPFPPPLILGPSARPGLSSHATVSTVVEESKNPEPDDELVHVQASPSIAPHPAPSKLLPIQPLLDKLVHLFFVPENPQKEFKYRYALETMHRELHAHGNLNTLLNRLRQSLNIDPEQAYTSGKIPPVFPFAANAYCAFRALDNPKGYKGIRQQYAHFLFFLRQALSQSDQIGNGPALRSAHDLLLKLCFAKYAKVEMYPHLQTFVLAALNRQMPMVALSDLAHAIHSANEQLQSAEAQFKKPALSLNFGASGKAWGALGLGGFDPTATSNTPYVHSKRMFRSGKEVEILRHGTPTADKTLLAAARGGIQWLASFVSPITPDSIQPEVIPEYKAFLRSVQDKNLLYVNHQVFSSKPTLVGESARSHALVQLEKEHPNFHCLCLPMDGKFWKQSYLEKASVTELKNDLLNALLLETDGFRLPRDLKKRHEKLRAHFTKVLDAVHEGYFSNAEEISLKDKWAFNMLFFSEIEDSFIEELNISYMNSSCKDDKDRGNARKIGNAIKNAMLLGKENDPKTLEEIFILALAPFIIKNEEIIEHRLEMGLALIDLVARLTNEQKGAIRNDPLIGCKLLDQQIPKDFAPQYGSMTSDDYIAQLQQMAQSHYSETHRDWNFVKECAAVYQKQGIWNLAALKAQITKDLSRIWLQLSGTDYSTKRNPQDVDANPEEAFKKLIAHLKLENIPFDSNAYQPNDQQLNRALTFLSMLQQGSSGSIAILLNRRFQGNLEINARQSLDALNQNRFATQISTLASGELRIVQYFELTNVDGAFNPIPILATIVVHGDGSATTTWVMS